MKSIKKESKLVQDEKLWLEKEVASLKKELSNISKQLEDADQALKEMKDFETHFFEELLELRYLKKKYEEELGRFIPGDFAYQFKTVLGRIIGTLINTVYDVKDFLKDPQSDQTVMKTLKDMGLEKDEVIKKLDNSIKAIMKI